MAEQAATQPEGNNDDELIQDQDDDTDLVKQLRAQLREKNSQLAETSQTAEQAAREAAFLKAGVDTNDGLGKFFFEKYDGEINPEVIAQQFEALGGANAAPDPGQPAQSQQPEGQVQQQVSAEEQAALQRQAAAGTAGAPPQPKSPKEQAQEAYQQAKDEFRSPEDARALYFQTLVTSSAEAQRKQRGA